MNKILILALVLSISACTSPPSNTSNVCSMFDERRSWYKAALSSEERWGVPIHVSMAIIEQESSYIADARPARKKYFGFIPGPRASSALGYAQVLDGTWSEYKRAAGRWSARRTNFSDAIDFIGWYNSNSYRQNNIAQNDAYTLYLAYHEGNGGFSRGSYKNKEWLLEVSRRVQANSERYQRQFQQCEAELGRNWFRRLLG